MTFPCHKKVKILKFAISETKSLRLRLAKHDQNATRHFAVPSKREVKTCMRPYWIMWK